MSYIPLYFIFLLCIVLGTALYLTRRTWFPRLPDRLQDLLTPSFYYTRLPSSFMTDVEDGLTSTAFDLSSNITEGDDRRGLDERGKKDVQRIMRARSVGFDEARRIYMEQRFKREGIGADGLPRDPKLVTFG